MIRALAIVALLAAPADARRCFSGPMIARPLIGQKPRMSGAGGMIVVGDKLPDWRFRVLNRIVRPDVVVLAPGLAIYHPPPLPGDEVVLEDTEHQLIARASRVFSIEPVLDPPAATGVASTTSGGRWVQVTATFPGKVPPTARVLIASRVDGARTVPIAWAFAGPGSTQVTVWHSPYGCDENITAWVQPKVGERVVLAWVDDAGRVSEPSRPIVISEGPKRR